MNRPGTPAEHPERRRWNERYGESGLTAFAGGPSDWLEEHRALLAERPGGRALDIACGNGRNALLLAELGYSVDAVDISDVAIERVDAEARRRGVSVAAHRLDLETDPFPDSDYAVILNFNYLDRSIFDGIRSSLIVGGLLLFHTRVRDPLEHVGSEIPTRFRLDPNELLHAFGGDDFRVLHYREGIGSGRGIGDQPALAGLVAERR